MENLEAYKGSIEKLLKLKIKVLKNENSKEKFILIENIDLKIRKDQENFDKELEKAKELRTWSSKSMKEMDKKHEEEFFLAERKECIEKHINKYMQYANCVTEEVEECSLKQLEPEPKKEVKIIELSIKTAQVTEWEFSEETVGILNLGKQQRNIAVVSYKETNDNVKVNKITKVLSKEERELCSKEIKVERYLMIKDMENKKEIHFDKEKRPVYKKIGKKCQNIVRRLKIFHRKTRKKKEISDNKNVREISEQPTQNTMENNRTLQEYKQKKNLDTEHWKNYNRESRIVFLTMLYIMEIHKMLAEIRKIDIFLRNFTKKKLEKHCMVA